jgi:putative endonuclease
MKFYYVYILKCADGTFYTGLTSNLDRRINQHNDGIYKNAYTYLRIPVVLLFYEHFTDVHQAIYFEKKIKKWSNSKKYALINGDYDLLKLLSECRNVSNSKFKQ